MAYLNEYHEKKTKYVRKKVVSEANYYFEEKWVKKYIIINH